MSKVVYTAMLVKPDPATFPCTAAPGPESSLPGFTADIYRCVDQATAGELLRLRLEKGIVPSCRQGCFACCGQHILATSVEARTVAEYLRREFTAAEIRALRKRTRRWHHWDRRRLQPENTRSWDEEDSLPCPLLVGGICTVYPVRPLTCRTHFVSTDPRFCRPGNDPKGSGGTPLSLSSVVMAAGPFSAAIRTRIEAETGDYLASIMLLPHWLSLEMGWAFAPSF